MNASEYKERCEKRLAPMVLKLTGQGLEIQTHIAFRDVRFGVVPTTEYVTQAVGNKTDAKLIGRGSSIESSLGDFEAACRLALEVEAKGFETKAIAIREILK
jgi:hypothetical protein